MSTKQRILDLLAIAPMTVPELAVEITDRKPITIDSALRDLRVDQLVRVVEWRRNLGKRGLPSPVWGLADGQPCVPRPKIKDAAAKAKRRYSHRNALTIAMRQQVKRHGAVSPFYQFIYTPMPGRRKPA